MKLRALIFDDDIAVRYLLTRLLEQHGYSVSGFSNPALSPLMSDEREMCQSGSACVDLIIADIDTPLIGGIELMTRQRRKGCKIANMALMSTHWSQGGITAAFQLGCRVFHKPTPVNELNEWISECSRDAMPRGACARQPFPEKHEFRTTAKLHRTAASLRPTRGPIRLEEYS